MVLIGEPLVLYPLALPRNYLTPYQRVELALKLEPLISEKARKKQLSTLKHGNIMPVLQISAEREIDTRDELSEGSETEY